VAELAAFVVVALVVICTPGPDTALTIRNSLLGGRRAGVFTAIGVSTGQALWTLAASAGIAALLVASEPAFRALKLLGAAYLVWLGLQTLWGVARRRPRLEHRPRQGLAGGRAWRQGVLSNLANPKMAAFFTSLLPQFGEASFFAMLGFGLLFCTLTLGWLTGYAFVVARAGDVLRRERVRRAIDAVMGAVLVAFGLRLATERRT
jgi:threonine/homoserine/homoserine lactone efflux protein